MDPHQPHSTESPRKAGEDAATADSTERATVPAWPWLALFAGCIACAALMATQITGAYVDFGDGNYLYIASRIADGLVPYRDIMAPQPPAHLLVGSWLLLLGEKIGAELLVVRWFSIGLRIGTALLVASIARVATRSPAAAVLAGWVYLFLPNSLIWNIGYQSEPLEILFLAAAVRLILVMRPAAIIAASTLSALACFTNMTAVPYVGLAALWLLIRRPALGLAYVVPLAVLGILGVAVMELWTGAYLQNVFFNQVGTYPKDGLLGYMAMKLRNASRDILYLEGFTVLASLAGIALYFRRDESADREFLPLFCLASIGSIVFVTKGGTMQYIFCIGEPYVAVGFACFAAWLARGEWRRAGATGAASRAAVVAARTLRWSAAALLVAASFAWSGWMLREHVLGQRYLQLTEERVGQVAEAIRAYTNPRDPILAHPWFAYDTRRLVAGEYCEVFIWTVGYWVEQDFDFQRRPLPSDGPFTRKVLELVRMLERHEIPLVILDMKQTGAIPIIQNALALHYRPLAGEIYWTRDTPLAFFIPRALDESDQPLAATFDELYPLSPSRPVIPAFPDAPA